MKVLVLLAVILSIGYAGAVEPHVAEVIRTVSDNVAKLKAADPEAVPMAFWDCDGTLIDGDVTEGLVRDGKADYKGLMEETILSGLNTVYRGADGWRLYRDTEYPRLCAIGRWLGWPYNAQMFAGVREADLNAFAERHFEKVLAPHYFASSVAIMRALEKIGVENYVISASPEVFVAAAAKTLQLPRSSFRGIRVKISGGRLTTEVVYPIPAGEGKVENLRDIVLARGHGVAVAGFGNSYSTDGAFLRYIVTQHLLGDAHGFALMINGGTPPAAFRGLFKCVEQREVVGETVR